jgi:hypothetical protein
MTEEFPIGALLTWVEELTPEHEFRFITAHALVVSKQQETDGSWYYGIWICTKTEERNPNRLIFALMEDMHADHIRRIA